MRNGTYLIILIFLLTNKLSAQDITGLWKGTLFNDTTHQFYRYEIAISEEKGKLTGFSHTWFILNDKQYYGVKKVKIKKQNDKVIIEDVELIANNYPVLPAKGVRQLNILTLETKDSLLFLSGPFTTNNTKTYHAISGTINVGRRNDFWQSALVPHLQELGLAKNLSFVQEEQRLISKNLVDKEEAVMQDAAMMQVVVNVKQVKAEKPGEVKQEKEKANIPVPVIKKLAVVPAEDPKVEINIVVSKPKEVNEVVRSKKEKNENADLNFSVSRVSPPAENVNIRRTVLQQTVYFISDSLQLSLYDNGEIDGDTVSVLMNGKIIFAKERLSTNAVRKTIAIDKSMDSVSLVMYAENLGTIAPNTGLLVVKDGKDIYEIRFSGDLQKNAAIVFKRKR